MYRGKQSKKRNNLQYIHRFMYIFIYIYLYSNFCSFSCCFWTTILSFYFSCVNLQLKVGANGDEVLDILVLVVLTSYPLFLISSDMGNVGSVWAKDVSDCSNKPLEKQRPCRHIFQFSRQRGGSQRGHTVWRSAIPDIWHLVSVVIVNSNTAQVDVQGALY